MPVIPLCELSDWQLADERQDIRGRPLLDDRGRLMGVVRELLVDTQEERVAAIRTDDGTMLPVEPLEIRDSAVIVKPGGSDPPAVAPAPVSVSNRSNTAATRSGKGLRNAGVQAKDGSIGYVQDLYFDDQTWSVRYLVVATSEWLTGRTVLITPEFVAATVTHDKDMVDLTKEQIRQSPDVSSDLPVSRQNRARLAGYYGWAAVPPGAGILAMGSPEVMVPPYVTDETHRQAGEDGDDDPHLRSLKEVTGYHVRAEDGEMGHVEDLRLHTNRPLISSIVIDTSNAPGGRLVSIPTNWVKEIRAYDRRLMLTVPRVQVLNQPEFKPQ